MSWDVLPFCLIFPTSEFVLRAAVPLCSRQSYVIIFCLLANGFATWYEVQHSELLFTKELYRASQWHSTKPGFWNVEYDCELDIVLCSLLSCWYNFNAFILTKFYQSLHYSSILGQQGTSKFCQWVISMWPLTPGNWNQMSSSLLSPESRYCSYCPILN